MYDMTRPAADIQRIKPDRAGLRSMQVYKTV
nr:MAG TPA: hypothetical protein [Caudoviricetes sp.]